MQISKLFLFLYYVNLCNVIDTCET